MVRNILSKCLAIIIHHGNANCFEISSYPSQTDCRCRARNTYSQLMRVQADVTTMKISVEVPHKKKQLKIDLPHK